MLDTTTSSKPQTGSVLLEEAGEVQQAVGHKVWPYSLIWSYADKLLHDVMEIFSTSQGKDSLWTKAANQQQRFKPDAGRRIVLQCMSHDPTQVKAENLVRLMFLKYAKIRGMEF